VGLCLLSFENPAGVRAEYLFMGTPVLVAFYALFLHANRQSGASKAKWRAVEWLYWAAAVWLLPWLALRLFFGRFEVHAVLFHMQEGLGSSIDVTTVLAITCSVSIVAIAFHAALVLARRLPWPSLSVAAA